MSSTAMTAEVPQQESVSEKAAKEMLDSWDNAVNIFRCWERSEIIEKEPSHEELAEHRRALTWILRWTRLLQTQVVDPEFPAQQFAPQLAGRLLQLEESWSLIHDPMPEAEADAILKAAFPDEPGPGDAR
jgi:hypothetical protein